MKYMNTEQTTSGAPAWCEQLPDGEPAAVWHSEAGFAAPTAIEYADDTTRADQAMKKMRNGIGNFCRPWGVALIAKPKRPIMRQRNRW